MKKLFLSILTLAVTLSAYAQNNTTAQEATDELVKVYDLTKEQADKMLVIQQRKVRNLAEITEIKTSDIKKYRHKFRAIQQSTNASIRRMLSEEQMKIYQQKRVEWREDRAAKIAELKGSGMTLEEIEDQLLEEGF